uniref:Uncharacterized protein n=1 Tax=Arundo donax TaxID=35708 RepID=A0A0A9HG64_ARUDO
MEVFLPQAPPASRTFLLDLHGLLEALRAEDTTADCCRGLFQLVPTYRAGESLFLLSRLSKLFV